MKPSALRANLIPSHLNIEHNWDSVSAFVTVVDPLYDAADQSFYVNPTFTIGAACELEGGCA